jgi:hypothetical protein
MTFTPTAPAGPCPNCGVAAQLITNGSLTCSNCGYMALSGRCVGTPAYTGRPDALIDTSKADFAENRDTGRVQSATESFWRR